MIVGDAQVVVHAVTDRVRGDIQRAFDRAGDDADKAGRDSGDRFGSSFGSSASDAIGNSVKGAVSDAGHDLDDLGTKVDDVVSGRGARGGGRGLFDDLSKGAEDASKKLTGLIATGNFMGSMLFNVVGALSAVVSGLFAMGSAASVAAGALVVIPGVLGAVLQGFAGLKLAFAGVGGAVSAGTKAASMGVAGLGQSTQAAANAVANAKDRLQAAYESATKSAEDSSRKITSAERDLADAQDRSIRVQRELTDARTAAAESLQQLGFNAEDAALGEQRAALKLEDAFAALQKVQSLAPDSRARREAELAFKEAELGLREAKDRASDLAKEQQVAAAAGVEGSAQVVKAQSNVADAARGVTDAQQKLALARRDADAAAVKSARDIVQAQRALADAIASATKHTGAGATALNAYNRQLAQLSPEAQHFVRFLIGMQNEFKGVKAAAGAQLFPQLETTITRLATNLFPILNKQLSETGRILGGVAVNVADVVTSSQGLSQIDSIMGTNNKALSDLGSAFTSVFGIILNALSAAGPLILRFTGWLSDAAAHVKSLSDEAAGTGRMTAFFNRAGDVAAQLGRIIGNLALAIFHLGQTAQPAGQSLLDSFEKATAKLDELIQHGKQTGELQTFFTNASDNLRQIGDLVNTIVLEFLKLGDNKAIGKLATDLKPAVEGLGKIADQFITAGPAAGDFANAFTQLVTNMTQAGGIESFFKTLTSILDVLNTIFGNSMVQSAMNFGAPFFATARAIAFVGTISGFVFKSIIGSVSSMIGIVKGGVGAVQGLGGAFKALKAGEGIKGAAAAFKAKVTGRPKEEEAAVGGVSGAAATFTQNLKKLAEQFVATGVAKDEFILNLKKLSTAFSTGGAVAGAKGAAGAGAAAGGLGGIGGGVAGAEKAGAQATKAAAGMNTMSKASKGLGVAMKGMGAAVSFALGPLGIILTIASILIPIIIELWKNNETFRNVVLSVWNAVKIAIMAVWDVVRPIFDAILGFFKDFIIPALLLYAKVWTTVFGVVLNVVTSTISVIINIFQGLVSFISSVVNVIIAIFTPVWKIWSTLLSIEFAVIKAIFNGIIAFISGVVQVIIAVGSGIWNFIITGIQVAWAVVQAYINLIIGIVRWVVGTVVAIGSGIWNFISGGIAAAYNTVVGWINNIVALVTGLGGRIATAATGIWNGISNAFKSMLNTVIGWWNNFSLHLEIPHNKITDFLHLGGLGFTVDTPNLPTLAKGGVVLPTQGGTAALLAEAGRPERVEPLDSQGLSTRDKAMIAALLGDQRSTIGQLNVYPSPGMNEAELARKTSKEIAWSAR